ncbi:hypothetical protein ACH5RR_023896 [Cinchona calisaya]|uniref:Uncharacterized protein n=1 Tax=Cinchona calisaya TaxID=153742 RepID=A0ABD2ZD16_9GENT
MPVSDLYLNPKLPNIWIDNDGTGPQVDGAHIESDNIGPQVDRRQGGTNNIGPKSGIGPPVDGPHDATDNIGLEEGVTNENLMFVSHEGPSTGEISTVQNEDIRDGSDSTYSRESEESTDIGDSFSGTCDPIIDGEDDQGFNPPINIAMINEDYMEYVARRNGGQILDDGHISDLEILAKAHGSFDENDGLGFREFNEKRDIQNANILLG